MRLLSESLIIGLLLRFSDFLYDGLKKSLVGGIFTAYDSGQKACGECLAAYIPSKLGLGGWFRRLKLFINKQFENSLFIVSIQRLLKKMLDFSLRQYGVFFFTFGTYTTALYIISRYIVSLNTLPIVNLYVGLAIMAASFPAIFVKRSLSQCILGSSILELVLFRFLGIRRTSLEGGNAVKGWTSLSFILGTVTGLLTVFVTPLYVPLAFMGLIAAVMLISTPETGVLMILFALPFLPTMMLAALIIVVALCYFLKLVRGKRTLRLGLCDCAVLTFMALMALGGLVSVSSGSLKPALLYCCLMFGYFLVVGLIRTAEWVMRCVVSLIGGSFFVALLGIYENFFGMAQSTWHDEELFEEISGRVVSTFENPNVLAEYLIMILPFMLTLLLIKGKVSWKLAALITGGAAGLCLIFTWSRGAWLGIMFAVIVYMLIYSRKTMLAFAVGICAVPFLPFVLPQSIINRFLSIGNLKDTSTNYRVNIWKAVINLVEDHFGGGIGVGTAAFGEVYPEYSLAAIESAPHSHNLYLQILVEIGIFGLLVFIAVVFLMAQSSFSFYAGLSKHMGHGNDDTVITHKLLSAAGFCGIIAILVQGMTDHVWYNYRVFCMFWLIMGLTMAVRRAAENSMTETGLPESSVDLVYEE